MDEQHVWEAMKATDKFLDEILEGAEDSMLSALRELERRIIDLSARLQVDKNGHIKGPKWTLKQAQDVHKRLTLLFEEIYGKAIAQHVEGFDRVSEFVAANLVAVGVQNAFSDADKQLLAVLKKQAGAGFEALGKEAQERIAKAVYDACLTGEAFSKLVERIKGAVTGHRDIRGRPLSQYAGTYAHDSLMDIYATMHRLKANESGFEHFIYYGDVIKDSRPFCIARCNRMYTKEQIDRWNKLSWSGKRPGNVWINRGGYRCRHHFQAVRPEWLGLDPDAKEGGIEFQRFDPGNKG